jgi:polyisoprenoid-binding protein YceI
MMVTHVRGHFKDVHGTLDFDPKDPAGSSVEVAIDTRKLWTGEPARDAHLRSADFLDVENFSEISFRGNHVVVIGEVDYRVTGKLTIRGVTRPVTLEGSLSRAMANTLVGRRSGQGTEDPRRLRGQDRHQSARLRCKLERQDGPRRLVGSNIVEITIDAEAILETSVG